VSIPSHFQDIGLYKCVGVTTHELAVTWRYRSRDHWIPHRPFPIVVLWNQASISLFLSSRYGQTSTSWRLL